MNKITPLFLGLFIGLVVIELSLRIFHPQRTTLNFYDNPVFGSAFVPNQEGWFVSNTKEYATGVKINSQGWPDVEHSLSKPDDVFRILILGDSFVENLQVPFENRFFRQLQDQLAIAVPNKKIEVIAVGRGNTGTAQQYLILKNYGLIYHPDLVVQMFFTANDVANNDSVLQNDPYLPYFKLTSTGELEEVPHVSRVNRKQANVKDMLKNLEIVKLALSVRQKIREQKANLDFGYPIDYHVYDNVYSAEYQTAWNTTYKLVTETKKLVQDSGAKYLLVTIPGSEQFVKNKQQDIFSTYPAMNKNTIDFEKPDKLLKKYCVSQKIDCKFMLPMFKDYLLANPDKATYYYYDGHWTETGTNLAADFLFINLKDYFKIK